jgi:hypothetical protein
MEVCEEQTQLEGSCHSEDLNMKAEISPLFEAETREQLVKTQKAGNDFVCVAVICKVQRLAMVL